MRYYRQLSPVRAVSFDLDDTLYDNQPVIARVEHEMALWLHQHHPVSANLSMASWQQIKSDVVQQQPELRHDLTRWRHRQIEQGLIQLGYQAAQANQAADQGVAHALWLRNQITVPTQTHQVLKALQQAYPLIAITNGNADPNQFGLGDYFSLILRAGPDGRAKPYIDMFARASQALSIPVRAILHVGDHPVSDVMGAKQAGMQACWLNLSGHSVRNTAKMRLLPDIEITDLQQLTALLP